MRMTVLTSISALCFWGYPFLAGQGFDLASILEGPSPVAQAAIEIRCGDLRGDAVSNCASQLTARIAAGRIDPEAVLRLHCTRIPNVWIQRAAPEPPQVCTQQFGGWLAS